MDPAAQPQPPARGVRIALRVALALFVTAALAIALGAWVVSSRITRKSSIPHPAGLPNRTGDAADPILQLESHTCGLLALSAAYRSYGLSPEAEQLRERLGVDVPASPLDETSTGTLHPDLLRVLTQDGFFWECVPLENPPDAARRLEAHLRDGNVALVLIARRETGGLHWVLTDAADERGLRVVDSLRSEAANEPVSEFLSRAISIIALQPAYGAAPEQTDAHAEGVREMLRARSRWLALTADE